MPSVLSRRGLLSGGGSAAAVPLAAGVEGQHVRHGSAPVSADAAPHLWRCFNAEEARFIAAAVDRLIPPDHDFTAAVGAGVPEYMDAQLAGAWGQGDRLYRQAPFAEGTPEQGCQLPFTPAELYRAALPVVQSWVRSVYDQDLHALDPRLQDELLSRLESGEVGFDEVPAAIFFETLLANTVEGFFSDPMHGGNRGMVGWRMVGFPGPFAGYGNPLERHNLRYARAPRGIAQAILEHTHHPAPRLRR